MRCLQVFVAIVTTVAVFATRLPATYDGYQSSSDIPKIKAAASNGDSPHPCPAPVTTPFRIRGRGRRGFRGAIYARYSTKFQHSVEDQIAACRKWAKENGIDLDDDFIFVDRAKTGKTHRRAGLDKLLEAIGRDEVDVVITFATNRLYRKMYRSLQFIDEEIVSRRKRCVFVAQNIDTAKSEFWRQLIVVFGMLDELQLQAQAGFVRAAHEGLLNQEFVHGTVTFGYRGEVVEGGRKTNLGRPRRRLQIDDESAKWVRQIFQWFTVDRLSFAAIKRLLRQQNAPLPPKSQAGIWTSMAVRMVLANRRYIGDFSYAWKDAVWQAKQGYMRQYQREKPRVEKWIERLRIIDNATFNTAQERLADYRGRGGRRKQTTSDQQPPDVLKDLLYCPKHNHVLTASGRFLQCRQCKEEDTEGLLYSNVNREVALKLVCETIAGLVKADADFVQTVKACIGEEIHKLQIPHPGILNDLDKEFTLLTRKIDFLLDAPAESEQDQKEQHTRLRDLQRQRAAVQEKRERVRAATQTPIQVPTDEQITQEITRIGSVLETAGTGETNLQLMSDARQIIEQVTGGRIEMSQEGEAQAERGWLKGTFHPQLLGPFLKAAGSDIQAAVNSTCDGVVSIDFREPPELIALSEQVKSMADQGLMMAEIALRLNLHRSRITLAIRYWFQSRGLPIPDGRSRRSTLAKKHLIAPLYQKIADDVMRMVDEGLKLGEVAQRLDVDRNTVTQAVKYWHDQRNLPLPPAQGRRLDKSLKVDAVPCVPSADDQGERADDSTDSRSPSS